MAERLPRTDAEADLLKSAIAELLRTIPETWAEFDLDRLTVIQDNALFLLTAAGMVERRGWLRSTIANHLTEFEVRFQATGEDGFAKAIEKAVAAEYETWKEAWRTWKTGETKDVSPFRTEAMKPQEWRLTDQGLLGRGELDGTKHVMGSDATFDFIFKRGFFGPGYWSRLAVSNPKRVDRALIEEQSRNTGRDWTNLPRPPLSGSGLLVEIRKGEKPAVPQSVKLTNWDEGADALAAAFEKMFRAMSKANDGAGSPPTDQASKSEGSGGAGASDDAANWSTSKVLDTLAEEAAALQRASEERDRSDQRRRVSNEAYLATWAQLKQFAPPKSPEGKDPDEYFAEAEAAFRDVATALVSRGWAQYLPAVTETIESPCPDHDPAYRPVERAIVEILRLALDETTPPGQIAREWRRLAERERRLCGPLAEIDNVEFAFLAYYQNQIVTSRVASVPATPPIPIPPASATQLNVSQL